MCLADIDHCLYEVFAVKTEYPCNTDYEVLIKYTAYSELTVELALPVHIKRCITLIVRLPGTPAFAIENIIRR